MKQVDIVTEVRFDQQKLDVAGRPVLRVQGFIGATRETTVGLYFDDGEVLDHRSCRFGFDKMEHPERLIEALRFAADIVEEALQKLEKAVEAVKDI